LYNIYRVRIEVNTFFDKYRVIIDTITMKYYEKGIKKMAKSNKLVKQVKKINIITAI